VKRACGSGNCAPQSLASRHESDGSRAFAAYLFQHGVIIARADAEIAGNDFSLALFRQNAGEEASTLVSREAFRLKAGLRQWVAPGLVSQLST